MNKYSKKIIRNLDNLNIDISKVDLQSNKFVNEILQCVGKVPSSDDIGSPIITKYNSTSIDKKYPNVFSSLPNYKKMNFNDFILKKIPTYKCDGYDKTLCDMIYGNDFVGIDIQHDVEIHDIIKYEYKAADYDLTIYNYKNDNYHEIALNKIVHIIKLMKCITGNPTPPTIRILLSKQKKCLNNLYGKVLMPIHVNSGSSLTGEFVQIWRREELYKVLIHELIHFYDIDFKEQVNNKALDLKKYLKTEYNINGHDCANESYTEFLALLINCCFSSVYLNINVTTLFNYEIKFTLFQICKILKFLNINSFKDGVAQSTSALSYYYIKGLFLINNDKVFKFLNNDIANIKITDIKKFSDLIKECEQNDNKMMSCVEYDKFVSKVNRNFLKNTMRMTAVQVK